MKAVRFWGTRGSLPVALTARDVREKLLGTLRAARGRPLDSESDLESILAAENLARHRGSRGVSRAGGESQRRAGAWAK
jgi:hypothetical protein